MMRLVIFWLHHLPHIPYIKIHRLHNNNTFPIHILYYVNCYALSVTRYSASLVKHKDVSWIKWQQIYHRKKKTSTFRFIWVDIVISYTTCEYFSWEKVDLYSNRLQSNWFSNDILNICPQRSNQVNRRIDIILVTFYDIQM